MQLCLDDVDSGEGFGHGVGHLQRPNRAREHEVLVEEKFNATHPAVPYVLHESNSRGMHLFS